MDSGSEKTTHQVAELTARVERLAELADTRWRALVDADRAAGLDPDEPDSPAAPRGPRQRARELRDHVRTYLVPRARDLDAPLLVAIIGPTGAGKSSVLNTVAGSPVSRTGVLRPTTRRMVVVGTDTDIGRLVEGGALASIDERRLELHIVSVLPDVVLVDTPDVDSVEHENRALADRIVEAADLCIFVTTATRYADRVPWDVLARAGQRGLPLIVVLNRMPPREPDTDDAETIREDMARLIGDSGLQILEIMMVPEGAVDDAGAALDRDALRPLLDQLAALSADADARHALAASALAGALAGIVPLVDAVADDLERQAAAFESLSEQAQRAYAEQKAQLFKRLSTSTVLRAEIIRLWHSYVGADRITRLFSSGIGELRGMLARLLGRTPPPPISPMHEGIAEDIIALVKRHADEAARAAAAAWSADPEGQGLVDAHPELWSSSDGLEPATRMGIDEWWASIGADAAERGAGLGVRTRVAAVGVNVVAVSVMLIVFTSAAGVPGIPAAAATALLSQKLLEWIFGKAVVQELLRGAEKLIRASISTLLDGERQRFDELLGDPASLRELADKLRKSTA